ncbi:MAG: aldose 1-epimerase [Anaerolineae bacterium]
MRYLHTRNYGCRLSTDYSYRGLRVVVMENEKLRLTILLDKGSDIHEFLYKPQDVDFMWHSPIEVHEPHLFVPSSGLSEGYFMDYYQGGWQEILPSGGDACTYKGAPLGMHGEICNIPWNAQVIEDSPQRVAVKFWVRTYRTPFYLEKILSLESDRAILGLEEKLVNEGAEEMDFMWGHHPTIGPSFLDEHCRLDVPARKVIIHPVQYSETNRLPAGRKFQWPLVEDRRGETVDLSRIPSPEVTSTDVAYLTDFEEGWCALTNARRRLGFALVWDKAIFRYLWFWQVYGGWFGYPWYGRTYNIGLEPWTSYPATGLPEAIKNGSALKLGPGETLQTKWKAVVYIGLEKVEHISPEGEVS